MKKKDDLCMWRVKNVNNDCREDCEYINENGEHIHIEENCMCSFNKEISKHCKLGNGEQAYKDFFEMKKQFLLNPEYTKYCHTVERYSDDLCVELIKINRTVAFRQFAQDYNIQIGSFEVFVELHIDSG